MGFPGGSKRNKSACHVGDVGSIPGSGGSPGGGNGTHFSGLAWRSPWTKEPARLHPMGPQRVGHDLVTDTFAFTLYIGDTLIFSVLISLHLL